MTQQLAIDGGTPVRPEGLPARGLIGEEEKAAAMAVFDEAIASGNAFGYGGEHEQKYEQEFADMMGGGFADAVNSGTNAVYCALGGLRLDAFSEVIVPAITDPGGMMPVPLLGCVPVVADCDPRSYNTSAEEIEPLITERTRAIVVAHIAGEPVEMAPVVELARKHNLYLVEDCAQAHGAKYKGEVVGTIGDVACFSTMFGKHHCTGGQGGVVYTKDEELFWNVKRFADRGKPFNIEGEDDNVVAGLNCNLNDLAAAIGSVQLKKLPGIAGRRHDIGEALKARLAGECRAVSVGWQAPDTYCVYWFLRVKLDLAAVSVDKAAFCAALAAEGMPVTESYRATPGERPWCVNKAVFGNSGFPWDCSDYAGPREPQVHVDNAIAVTDVHFNIGLHENYGEREIDDIVAALRKVEDAYAV
jgi:perosamine synthetase